MCTVTFLARRHGYALGMNRDEQRSRPAGLRPRLSRAGPRTILAPREPSGGTWVGVNDSGAALALVNWYAVPSRATGATVSRGEVAGMSLAADSPGAVEMRLAGLPLGRVRPFRLIGIFPALRAVAEWRWNLERLEYREHRWRTNVWISSGYDEPGAQRVRGSAFRQALGQASCGSLEWLRRFHRSHHPERGPYCPCMHRADAATVSYTEIVVARRAATMRYTPGAPCCTAPSSALCLPLNS